MSFLGHIINVYTDHRDLTNDNFKTEKVLRWRLLLEVIIGEIPVVRIYIYNMS